MNKHIPFTTPAQADVDRHIAQAQQLRSEYISRSLKAGVIRLKRLLTHKGFAKPATPQV